MGPSPLACNAYMASHWFLGKQHILTIHRAFLCLVLTHPSGLILHCEFSLSPHGPATPVDFFPHSLMFLLITGSSMWCSTLPEGSSPFYLVDSYLALRSLSSMAPSSMKISFTFLARSNLLAPLLKCNFILCMLVLMNLYLLFLIYYLLMSAVCIGCKFHKHGKHM